MRTDTCTAVTRDWQHAFGIVDTPRWAGSSTLPDPPRAFLGWKGEKVSIGAWSATETTCNDYGTTLNVFYDMWMSGATVDQCITVCSVNYRNKDGTTNPSGLHLPLPVRGNEKCILSDGTYFWRYDIGGQSGCPPLKLVGYPGLTRSGYDPSYWTGEVEYSNGGAEPYAAPPN